MPSNAETETGDVVQRAAERFPEVELIGNKEVREETARAIVNPEIVKPYFWRAPAASSYKYHNPYCCEKYGLWIHTKMVFAAYERLVDSWEHQAKIDQHEADLGRAAVLLHDGRKYGRGWEEGKKSTSDHDLDMADAIREETELDDGVADAVASHMGPWYEGPSPQTPLQQLVHQADMAASTKNGTFGVYKPPEQIKERHPQLPEAILR